ncbi:MAG: hypothetical protein WCO97_04900, partial [bacterium]
GDLLDLDTWLGVFKKVIDTFAGVLNIDTWLAVFKKVIDTFAGILHIDTWLPIFKQVIDFFVTLLGTVSANAFAILQEIIEFFADLFDGNGTIVDWLGTIPVVAQDILNSVWSLLTGGDTAIGKNLSDVFTRLGSFASSLIVSLTGNSGDAAVGDVASWARKLLNGESNLAAGKLLGQLPAAILALIPVANINIVNENLLDGAFGTTATLTPAAGWIWDSTQTHSTGGGSAKVVGNGAVRELFNNQSVAVAAGDKLTVSCWVKSTGTVGADGIALSVVEFNGTTQGLTRTIASRTSSAGWVQIGNTTETPYTVGAGVTQIRVRLAVTAAAVTGSSIWFDDIDVRKIGLLSGSWMEGILGTVVEDFQAIADAIAQAIKGIGTAGSGNALTTILTNLQTIFTRMFGITQLPTSLFANPLLGAAIPTLDGSKIGSGSIANAFIGWLDGSKIQSGYIGSVFIPSLDASKIGSGTFSSINIPFLDSAKIASGTLGATRIPSLDGSKIGSGSIAAAFIALLDAAKIATGFFGSARIPSLDGSKIGSGTVAAARLDLPAIGAAVNPTEGSGALLVRTSTGPVAVGANGFNAISTGFFTTLSTASTDIQCMTSAGTVGTGARSDYTGTFRATIAGWYMVELAYKVNANLSGGWKMAPVLYRNSSQYKVGTDVDFVGNVLAGPPRYVQASWIVYLDVGDYVQAGYTVFMQGVVVLDRNVLGSESGVTGVETYFSMSLLNRSYA